MQVPDAVLVLAKAVGEARERRARTEPDEPVGPQLGGRLEMLRERLAHPAVDAVGPHDQIGLEVSGDAGVLGLVVHRDAELRRAPLQDLEQRQPADAGEPVAARLHHAALVPRVDVVPVGEVGGDVPVARLVGAAEVRERLVREHDAEAERVVGAVALGDRDVGVGVTLLDEDGEVQPGRAAADHVYSHGTLLARGSYSSVPDLSGPGLPASPRTYNRAVARPRGRESEEDAAVSGPLVSTRGTAAPRPARPAREESRRS